MARDKELTERRNKAICKRYKYLTEVKHLRFDYVVEKLSTQEFFLSEYRIMAIIWKAVKNGDL